MKRHQPFRARIPTPMTSSPAPLLSILIPTIPSRQQQFTVLTGKLREQIRASALEEAVEIVPFLDEGQRTHRGETKWLLDQARGSFVVFVDDDDEVGSRYVPVICRAIEEHPEIDCIGIKGTILFAAERADLYSLAQVSRFRPPGDDLPAAPAAPEPDPPPDRLPLPVRRHKLLRRHRLGDAHLSRRALQHEYFLDEVIYIYQSRRHWLYQWLLDRSECIRHPLGLQLANRLRVRRWLSRTGTVSSPTPDDGAMKSI